MNRLHFKTHIYIYINYHLNYFKIIILKINKLVINDINKFIRYHNWQRDEIKRWFLSQHATHSLSSFSPYGSAVVCFEFESERVRLSLESRFTSHESTQCSGVISHVPPCDPEISVPRLGAYFLSFSISL